MNMPISWDVINIIDASYTPSSVVKVNNGAFRYYCRYFWQKAVNVFKFTLPDTWSHRLFTFALFGGGCVAVVDTGDKFGVIPQWAVAGGFNVFYDPLYLTIANPLLNDLTGKQLYITKDCAAIHLTPDWMGIGDLIGFYAEKCALATQAVDVNLINSKLSYVFGAKDKTTSASFKTMFDHIVTGEPSVVVDKKLFNDDGTPNWQLFTQNLKQTYIVSDLLSDLRKIEEEFDTKIGIPNANTDKRERLISDEVNANNIETNILADGWMENIQRGCKMVKQMYDVDIKVERRYDIDAATMPTPNAEQGKSVNSRSV